jgi:hypothetical protein
MARINRIELRKKVLQRRIEITQEKADITNRFAETELAHQEILENALTSRMPVDWHRVQPSISFFQDYILAVDVFLKNLIKTRRTQQKAFGHVHPRVDAEISRFNRDSILVKERLNRLLRKRARDLN